MYRLREVFEAFATKEAVPALTAGDRVEMDALIDQMAEVGSGDTSETWSRLNQAWHFKLYGGAQLPLLMQFISALWDRCRLTSHVYARDLSHRSRSNQDHRRIMSAVHAGEAELAAAFIATHVRKAMDDIIDQSLVEQPSLAAVCQPGSA